MLQLSASMVIAINKAMKLNKMGLTRCPVVPSYSIIMIRGIKQAVYEKQIASWKNATP